MEKNENNSGKRKGFFARYWWVILLICIIGVAAYCAAVGILTSSGGGDTFGKDHPIPEGLEYEIPKEADDPVEYIIDTFLTSNYLQVWKGIQGGVYQYWFSYPALPDGEVFLRCFEVTENIELSASRLRKASTVAVKNHTDFGLIADKQPFSIYEGDWGDYYAARIEVWHHDATTGKETKLMEKVFRVEGWMR